MLRHQPPNITYSAEPCLKASPVPQQMNMSQLLPPDTFQVHHMDLDEEDVTGGFEDPSVTSKVWGRIYIPYADKSLEMVKDLHYIGRHEHCDIQVDRAEISKAHCKIVKVRRAVPFAFASASSVCRTGMW